MRSGAITNFYCPNWRQASLFIQYVLTIGFKAISSQSYRAQNFVHHFTTNIFPVGRQSTDIDLDEFYQWAIFSRRPLEGDLIDICSYYLYCSEKICVEMAILLIWTSGLDFLPSKAGYFFIL